jgi:hypothetical protein
MVFPVILSSRNRPGLFQEDQQLARTKRPLWFDDDDRERILEKARELFVEIQSDVAKIFKEFPYRKEDAAKKSALKRLERSGLKKRIEDLWVVAPSAILWDRVGKDRWLETLFFPTLAELKGDELKEVVAHDKKSLEKWTNRLKVCDTTWEKASLSDDTIVAITIRLFKEECGETRTQESIRARIRRWKLEERRSAREDNS